MRQLLGVCFVLGLLAGCGRGDFAVQVKVLAQSTSQSVCTRVTATRGSTMLDSASGVISAGGDLDVFVVLDSAETITVQATGYDNADCAGEPSERSTEQTATPKKTAPFELVQLTLEHATTVTDGGFDAGFDAGVDDGGFDGGFDAGTDAGVEDAGFDAGFDAGIDDAGFDDAGFDAGAPDAGDKEDAGVLDECLELKEGKPCANDSGICNFQDICIPKFPYDTSNFGIVDLPWTDGGNSLIVIGGTGTINTDDGGFVFMSAVPFNFIASDGGSGRVMVIHVDSMSVGASGTVSVVGNNPLIIAVSGDANIDGNVFARDMGNSIDCTTAVPGAESAGTSSCDSNSSGNESCGGGGAGGSYGRPGGNGGNGGTSPSAAGGAAGAANGVPPLRPLRGGCAGARGGRGAGGEGGSGGGGLQISAADTLHITGTVAAPGRGGAAGGTTRGGGGGGGSGGAVLLEATLFQISGELTANGGSAGSGATGAANGSTGVDGNTNSALGAVGGGTNARGGDGGTGLVEATNGANSGGGGGGGGGGAVGRIRINAANGCINPAAVISPAQSTNGGTFIVDAGC